MASVECLRKARKKFGILCSHSQGMRTTSMWAQGRLSPCFGRRDKNMLFGFDAFFLSTISFPKIVQATCGLRA